MLARSAMRLFPVPLFLWTLFTASYGIASERYRSWLEPRMKSRLLLLELGVGGNTPGIIKYPFWQMTAQNPQAVYACINAREAWAPGEIADRSLCISADIGDVLEKL